MIQVTDPGLTSRVGNIAKQWRGCCVEMTDADQFLVTCKFCISWL